MNTPSPILNSQSKSQSQSTLPIRDPHHETTPSTPPTHEDIAIRAYNLYIQSGSQKGRCTHNWHQAERFLSDEMNATPAPTPITATLRTR